MERKHLLGFNKNKRQDMLILTGFGSIVDDSLNMVEGKGYAAKEKTKEAWGIDEENQINDAFTGRKVQLVTAWDPVPVRLFGPKNTANIQEKINSLASRVVDEEITWEEDRKKRHTSTLWLGICLTLLTLALLGSILPKILSHGKIPGVS